ncbi:GINS complex subunit 2 [Pseudoscourfieldia marina]
MALHHLSRSSSSRLYTPDEMTFCAEDALVEIVPRIAMPACAFLSTTIPPLRPNIPCTVPLWMALALKKRHAARIVIPAWLASTEELEALLERERNDNKVFQHLTEHYLEVAHLLLAGTKGARDDFASMTVMHKNRDLLEKLRLVRESKLNQGLEGLATAWNSVKDEGEEFTVPLNNISRMELNALRPLFQGALDKFWKLEHANNTAATTNMPSATPTPHQTEVEEAPVRRLRGR